MRATTPLLNLNMNFGVRLAFDKGQARRLPHHSGRTSKLVRTSSLHRIGLEKIDGPHRPLLVRMERERTSSSPHLPSPKRSGRQRFGPFFGS